MCPLSLYFFHTYVFGSYIDYAYVMDGITNGYITFYATFIFVFKL